MAGEGKGDDVSRERLVARSLAHRLDSGKPVSVTLRQIRDDELGGGRLTLRRKLDLQRALDEEGVGTSIPLLDAARDEPIVLTRLGPVTKPGRALDIVRSLLTHPLVTGTRRAVLAAVALAGALVALVAYFDDPSPRRMTGDLNVLAAGFVDEMQANGGALAYSLARSLRSSVAVGQRDMANPDVEVRGPADLAAPTDAAGAKAAAQVVDAHVVVYGRIARVAGRTMAFPRVYVDPSRLRGAEELGGDYPLGAIDAGRVPIGDAIAARVRLRTAVAHHLQGLAAFAMALAWFDATRWRPATRWLDIAAGAWPNGRRRAMVELFRGNVAGKSGKLALAQRAYRRAIRESPNLDRARLGLNEVKLHRTQRGCRKGVEAAALSRVSREFRRLGARSDGHDLSDYALRLRARLGSGRAAICMSLAQVENRWSSALRDLRAVVAMGSRRPGRFNTEVAEALAGLGLTSLPNAPTDRGADAAYRRARERYTAAIRSADDVRRVRVFQRMIRFIDNRLEGTGK